MQLMKQMLKAKRRIDFAEPIILRQTIDRLVMVGVLPEPTDAEYDVKWPDLDTLNEKEQVEIAESKTKALAAYVQALGAENIVNPEDFLINFLFFEREEAQQILANIRGERLEEDQEIVDSMDEGESDDDE